MRLPALLPTPASGPDLRAWITPEDLNVAPELLGQPLARPWRRALAMGLDLGLLSLFSQFGNGWLLLGLSWAAWRWVKLRDAAPAQRHWRVWLPILVLLGLGLMQAWEDALAQPASAPAAAASVAAARRDAAEADPVARIEALAKDAQIAALQARLEKLEEAASQPLDPRQQLKRWLDQTGLRYGWALAYFALWPLLWPGQTPGKRLLGLRVVELTGKPPKLMLNLRRYGGYAASLATGGLGFIQIFWDANRQGLHDKAAHTAVVDLRNPQRLGAEQA